MGGGKVERNGWGVLSITRSRALTSEFKRRVLAKDSETSDGGQHPLRALTWYVGYPTFDNPDPFG